MDTLSILFDELKKSGQTQGNFLGFLRADNSWHGHLPYEGERKVVQITWLESEADVERKKRDNALAQALKGLWPKRKSAA